MRRTSGRYSPHVQEDENCLAPSASSSQGPGPPLYKTHPKPRNSQPRRRNQGEKVKFRFVRKSELGSSNYEVDRSLEELSICENADVTREIDQGNKDGSELKTEVRDERERDDVADSSKEGDSIQGRLDKLLRNMGELELSEEQLSTNGQLQEDEVIWQFTFMLSTFLIPSTRFHSNQA